MAQSTCEYRPASRCLQLQPGTLTSWNASVDWKHSKHLGIRSPTLNYHLNSWYCLSCEGHFLMSTSTYRSIDDCCLLYSLSWSCFLISKYVLLFKLRSEFFRLFCISLNVDSGYEPQNGGLMGLFEQCCGHFSPRSCRLLHGGFRFTHHSTQKSWRVCGRRTTTWKSITCCFRIGWSFNTCFQSPCRFTKVKHI